MNKIFSKIISFYYLLKCAVVVAIGCTIVVGRHLITGINHEQMNRLVKKIAKKILAITKTTYHSSPFPQLAQGTPYIFMCNHESLLDIPMVYANVHGTVRFLIKKELLRIPIFGKMLLVSGCIPVDRSKRSQEKNFYNKVKTLLDNQIALWIFPEGTRSSTTELLPFKTGSFRFAHEISAKIIPVGIANTRLILPPRSLSLKMHQTARITFGEPIDASLFKTPEEQKQLILKVREAIEQLRK